ncbi:hypothetical protein CGGC5_v010293 [Colletotrichum fructicola Nara gc5]|uniref:Uncharacterized protein n=1 Tax=Colletotrichum fructicola (strain Nara gc5) TaxID=1213859 RepID=A0A7J6IUI2_COLFN|nr:hypothetical protein CGGC5_v017203 [Colletotrichum fructicola Nara gc5]KAF4480773.1 hypothetical protein CGGC5_v010293 [Colletotrichum fructicola Nara gc5]
MWTLASWGWAVRLSSILVLFALLQSIAAQDLGLNLDTHARDKAQQIVYSSKLTFTQDTEQPAMMAVMAVEKDVFISSSLKGSGPSLYSLAPQHSKPRVVAALDRCQARLQSQKKVPVNKKHRTEAGCAEIFAVHQYYLDSDTSQRAHNHPRSIRVVAYGKGGQTGVIGPQNPCGGGEVINQEGFLTWGCRQFMADEGITVPRKPGKKVDIRLPRPFPTFTHKQISVVPHARSRPTLNEGPRRVDNIFSIISGQEKRGAASQS